MTSLTVELQDVCNEVWDQNYRAPNELVREDTQRRVAYSAAANESLEIRAKVAEDFFWLMQNDKASTGGRVTANIGIESRLGTTLFNCYLFGPSASFGHWDPDSIDGIYDQLKYQALTLKSEGGYGTNASYIRPAGSYISGIGARTPGVLSFMELWNVSSKIITQGSEEIVGKRRSNEKKKIRKGAQMLVLEVWHPDIESFIDAKLVEGRFDKFNFSVGVVEGFIDAVMADESWDLVFPDTEFETFKTEWFGDITDWKSRGYPVVVYKTVKARYLWDKIMTATYTRNEPGVMFLDIANKMNPVSYAERLVGSNPCFHGDERFLTEKGYVKFRDSANGLTGERVLTDNRVSYVDNGGEEVPSNWKIDLENAGSTARDASNAFITKDFSELLEVALSNGQRIKCTPDHHFATTEGMVEAKDLTSSHKILVSQVTPPDDSIVGKEPETEDEKRAFLMGSVAYHGDMKNVKSPIYEDRVFPETSVADPIQYRVPEFILNNSRTRVGMFYIRGMLANMSPLIQGSYPLLADIQLILHSLGIPSLISGWQMVICPDFNKRFADLIGLTLKDLTFADIMALTLGGLEREDIGDPSQTTLISKTKIEGDTVYCIKEPITRSIIVNTATVRRCGEALLPVGGLCCLLSYNLPKYIMERDGNIEFDFDAFQRAVKVGSRLLDNIIDLSPLPLPEYGIEAKSKRRLGGGVLGLGSLFYILGMRYGSDESVELTRKIFKLKCETELLTSAMLGLEKGSFPLFDADIYFSSEYWRTLAIDPSVKKQIEEIGCMRNSHQSANAPTGNMGVYLGVMSGGIEPVFLKSYVRWITVSDSDRLQLRSEGFSFPDISKGEWFESDNLKLVTKGTDQVLKGTFNGIDYEVDKNRGLIKGVEVQDYGWKFVMENLSKEKFDEYEAKGVFASTDTLSVDDHLRVLKVVSDFTNQNSSKTINIPNDYAFEDFKGLYLDAYKAGIKGITTYRAGTMSAVLEKKEDIQEQQDKLDEMSNSGIVAESVSLPKEYDSKGYVIKDSTTKKKWYVSIAFWDHNCTKPFAIFVNTNAKEGSEVADSTVEAMFKLAADKGIPQPWIEDQRQKAEGQSNVTKIARSIGLCLRHNIPIIDIVSILEDGNYPLSSFSFHVKRLLKDFIPAGTIVEGKVCDFCGGQLVFNGTCTLCLQCNASKCS